MIRELGWMALAASLLVVNAANARDVACGEACDAKMNQCVAECEKPPKGQRGAGDAFEACWNECAKKEFHPCLDACKFPKPDWADE